VSTYKLKLEMAAPSPSLGYSLFEIIIKEAQDA
jgi:hypothetical protein